MVGRAASIVRQGNFERMIAAGYRAPLGRMNILWIGYPGRCPGLRDHGPLALRRRVSGEKNMASILARILNALFFSAKGASSLSPARPGKRIAWGRGKEECRMQMPERRHGNRGSI